MTVNHLRIKAERVAKGLTPRRHGKGPWLV